MCAENLRRTCDGVQPVSIQPLDKFRRASGNGEFTRQLLDHARRDLRGCDDAVPLFNRVAGDARLGDCG